MNNGGNWETVHNNYMIICAHMKKTEKMEREKERQTYIRRVYIHRQSGVEKRKEKKRQAQTR